MVRRSWTIGVIEPVIGYFSDTLDVTSFAAALAGVTGTADGLVDLIGRALRRQALADRQPDDDHASLSEDLVDQTPAQRPSRVAAPVGETQPPATLVIPPSYCLAHR